MLALSGTAGVGWSMDRGGGCSHAPGGGLRRLLQRPQEPRVQGKVGSDTPTSFMYKEWTTVTNSHGAGYMVKTTSRMTLSANESGENKYLL